MCTRDSCVVSNLFISGARGLWDVLYTDTHTQNSYLQGQCVVDREFSTLKLCVVGVIIHTKGSWDVPVIGGRVL